MSESKGRKTAVILSLVLFLAGSAITLSPWLHSLWVNYTMRRDVQEFLSYVEVAPYAPGQTSLHGTTEKGGETGGPFLPTEYTQLWLDMQSYNQVIFEEGQTGLSDPSAYEKASFCLAEYGLETEVFGVLTIPRLSIEMPIYLGASCILRHPAAAGAVANGN